MTQPVRHAAGPCMYELCRMVRGGPLCPDCASRSAWRSDSKEVVTEVSKWFQAIQAGLAGDDGAVHQVSRVKTWPVAVHVVCEDEQVHLAAEVVADEAALRGEVAACMLLASGGTPADRIGTIAEDVPAAGWIRPSSCFSRVCRELGCAVPGYVTSPAQVSLDQAAFLVGSNRVVRLSYFGRPTSVANHVELCPEGTLASHLCSARHGDLTFYVRDVEVKELFLNAEYFFSSWFSNIDKQVANLEKYHQYLQQSYTGGAERFFSPTGFLEEFQRSVEVSAERAKSLMFAKSLDHAVSALESVVNSGVGVYDLSAEPGTGKTTTLPFKFPSKRVVVALPTPFDAWAAYQAATGPCALRIKGLKLGERDSKVVYTDSYMAAHWVLSGGRDFDMMFVDECDSDRGVTAFLAEVRVPGKLLIRMSASLGTSAAGPTKAFPITSVSEMPDVRDGAGAVAQYVQANKAARSLVLMPDAQTAAEVAELMPEAVLVTSAVGFSDLAVRVLNQVGNGLFVADDVCARGLNMNLDVVFDSMLVAEHGLLRVITPKESYQRRGRVGRNRPGYYHHPNLRPAESSQSDVDCTRHNVVRAIAEIAQRGEVRLQVDLATAQKYMCASREPYVLIREAAVATGSVEESPEASDRSETETPHKHRSRTRRRKSSNVPGWVFYFSGAATDNRPMGDVTSRTDHGKTTFVRRRSSASSVSSTGSNAVSVRSASPSEQRLAKRTPMPFAAPRAVRLPPPIRPPPTHATPPIMDLTQVKYDMDWPELIRRRLDAGATLPTVVPPASWRHTSVRGMGSDWIARLDAMADADLTYSDREMEVVCRAWNLMVARMWTRNSTTAMDELTSERLAFSARYFQSYFHLSSAQ